MDTRSSPIPVRLESVRDALREQGVDALLVPSSDPHLSEYLPERWQGRVWLSGFTGSMATLVVTADRAALFADSRYWVQAERELRGSGIDLVKIPTGAATHHIEWLAQNVRNLGMPLYGCQPPTGYPDKAEAWVNTGALLNRMNFALQLVSGRMRGVQAGTSPVDAVLAGEVSLATRSTIAKASDASQIAALTLGSPEFQRR